MKFELARTPLFDHFRAALHAALAGTICAAWVPPVLFISFAASTLAIEGKLPSMSSFEEAVWGAAATLALAGLPFLIGAVCLVLVGFPTLLVLSLLRLRHPAFAALAAALLFVLPGRLRGDDLGMFVFFSLVTGYVAGLYARRAGMSELARSQGVPS